MSIPQGKEKFECVYSYVLLRLIQIMVKIKDKNVFLYMAPLFLCNTKVNLNYCVKVKEK